MIAADALATTCLDVLATAFPYAAAHVSRGADDVDVTPHRLHPSFHGSLDWHSSCHMQWSLLTLLPELSGRLRERVVALLDERLTPAAVRVEADYLAAHPSFERPYGWAWALLLSARARTSPATEAHAWAAALVPLHDVVVGLLRGWLAAHPLPVRSGVHTCSAFALSLSHRAATLVGDQVLAIDVEAGALRWFGDDDDLPTRYEPSGTDFLSPALSEAELMVRVLPPAEARSWLARALPGLAGRSNLLAPVPVPDDSDGHLAHLNGLALSRAWHLRTLAAYLPPRDADLVRQAADALVSAVVPVVSSGDFMSTHWLVSFLLLAEGR